jgi:hypothetical protein
MADLESKGDVTTNVLRLGLGKPRMVTKKDLYEHELGETAGSEE